MGRRELQREAVWDAVAVLLLFDAVNEHGNISGNLMIQKLGFLAEVEAKKQRLRAAHFRFFRYQLGPYSTQLANAVSNLEQHRIITTRRHLTDRARYVLEYARESIEASSEARAAATILRDVGRTYAKRSGADLKNLVYRLTVPIADFQDRAMCVRDVQVGVDIIDPARDASLRDVIPFDDDTVAELRAELAMPTEVLDTSTPHFQKTIRESLKRAATACEARASAS